MVDPVLLREQYAGADRLGARQALWRLRPGPSLPERVLDLAGLTGRESVVDVGCGNGRYLAELRRRGHTGPVLGLDRSPGMARESETFTATAVADVRALPLRDAAVEVALCLHMLYHVEDVATALAELRRVVRPGGRVVVTTNGAGHVGELDGLLARAALNVAGIQPAAAVRGFDAVAARAGLAAHFDTVTVVDLGATIEVDDPAIVTSYLHSYSPEQVGVPRGPLWSDVLAEVGSLVAAEFAARGSFGVTNATTVLIGQRV